VAFLVVMTSEVLDSNSEMGLALAVLNKHSRGCQLLLSVIILNCENGRYGEIVRAA
jgi:hypothetical protein